MTDKLPETAEKRDHLSKPERLFKSLSQWIGAIIFGVGMIYDLHLDKDVGLVIFAVGGGLMGVGAGMDVLRGMRK